MHNIAAIFRREFASYFATPIAFVFIVVFLVLVGLFTFQFGRFYESGQADLMPFFYYQPWLYLFLVPAITMRLWAEERKAGSIELLMTLPITLWQAVIAKFLAAWLFTTIALTLTFPMWITVNYLGDPDNGTILAGYIGSFLMAGGFLAIGSFVSSLTRSQVIAFVVTVVVCFGFLVAGYSPVVDAMSSWAPQWLIDAVARFSFLTNFDLISRGVLALRDLVFFLTLIALCLYGNVVALEVKKSA
jgi:ABC-2 type transport system permease protein